MSGKTKHADIPRLRIYMATETESEKSIRRSIVFMAYGPQRIIAKSLMPWLTDAGTHTPGHYSAQGFEEAPLN